MDIRYANLNELLQNDDGAVEFFHSLPKSTQDALLSHGGGINNLDELTHFTQIIERQGGKKHKE